MTIGQKTDHVDQALRRYGHTLYADETYIEGLWQRAQNEVESTDGVGLFVPFANPTLEIADRVALMVIASAYGKRALLECLAEETLRLAAAKDGN